VINAQETSAPLTDLDGNILTSPAQISGNTLSCQLGDFKPKILPNGVERWRASRCIIFLGMTRKILKENSFLVTPGSAA
jgi:hypothetical protein